MLKNHIFLLCLAFVNLQLSESKNVLSSFASFVKSKIKSENHMIKVIQMGNGYVCLTNSENPKYDECSCSFAKVREFEKKCASNLKKNQEEAKDCSEEKCEICCKLENKNESSNSILEYELICQKKCTKSDLVSDLNEDDNKLVFKKIIEFIRIFYPANTLQYHPEEKKSVEYTGKILKNQASYIVDDIGQQEKDNESEETYDTNNKTMEELFSPYDEK